MNFDLDHAYAILERTPRILASMLQDLADEWTYSNDGPDTWSAYQVVEHLIQGEQTNWLVRIHWILDHADTLPFEPFDRTGYQNQAQTLDQLLLEFTQIRASNIQQLRNLALTSQDFQRQGLHPQFGTVTLGQLLATWVAHDLNHIGQIAEVMACQYRDATGPWRAFLDILG